VRHAASSSYRYGDNVARRVVIGDAAAYGFGCSTITPTPAARYPSRGGAALLSSTERRRYFPFASPALPCFGFFGTLAFLSTARSSERDSHRLRTPAV